jgi:hypothetical protein
MKNLLCLFLFIQLGKSFGQEKKWTVIKIDTIALQLDSFIGYDKFGDYYYLKNNVFFKQNSTKNWQYKNLSLAKISKIDLQNPLNIVLFYENFNTILLLDNQLNEKQKINLSENNTPILATATGLAFGNRLWIYNSLSQQIGLFDYLKSEFTPITIPFKGTMKQYFSDFNTFQWIDEKQNWFKCSINGQITQLGKIPDYDMVQIISNSELIFKKNNELYHYSLKEKMKNLIAIDEKTFENFYYKDQILSIFTIEGITNYKIIIP